MRTKFHCLCLADKGELGDPIMSICSVLDVAGQA